MVACDDVSSSKELLLGQDWVGVYWEKKKKKKDEKKIWTIDLKSSKSNGAKVVFYGGRHDKFPNLASTKQQLIKIIINVICVEKKVVELYIWLIQRIEV